MKPLRLLIVLIIGGVLAGCVNVKAPPPDKQFQKISSDDRQAVLDNLHHWQIRGAFSLRRMAPNHTGKVVIASFNWYQQGRNAYKIRVSSSFDLYNLTLQGRAGRVALWKNARERYQARSPEALMQKVLGWSLPISDLKYWVRGVPAPGHCQEEYNEYGLLSILTQKGWNIRYTAYRKINGIVLPEIIYMNRPGTQIKIVIKRWILPLKSVPIKDV